MRDGQQAEQGQNQLQRQLQHAYEIYERVKQKNLLGKGEQRSSLLGVDAQYIIESAKDELTNPDLVEQLSRAILDTPQIKVDAQVERDKVNIPLPFDLIYDRYLRKVEEAAQLSHEQGMSDIYQSGENVRQKAMSVLERLSQDVEGAKSVEEAGKIIDQKAFEALEKQGFMDAKSFNLGQEFWWKTVISNILMATELHKIAKKRGSTMAFMPETPATD